MAEIFQFLIKGHIKAYFKPIKANLRPLGQADSCFNMWDSYYYACRTHFKHFLVWTPKNG